MENSFYERAGDRAGDDSYLATPATAGPWSAAAQHGGPPSALAVWAMERHQPDERQRLARVAVDILRPVPVGKMTIRTRTVRPGRRVALLETIVEADGLEVMAVRGWRIERPAGDVPAVPDAGSGAAAPLPQPDGVTGPTPEIFSSQSTGYLASIEWQFLPPAATVAGPTGRAAWTRPRIPLLPGEDPPPMSRVLLVADSGSGISAVLSPFKFIFINVDLTVVLPRDPAGDWLLLESATTVGSDGTGLATTRLSDQRGVIGRGFQTLLVAPR